MVKTGVHNPLFLLDEIDKLGTDFRGDPSSALLEVLDPEQNNTFRDHYLDVSFDLSKVMFIATANLLDPIPAPLRDRMEILELSGYTDEDKLNIARKYLVPKQLRAHGLPKDRVDWTDEGILAIIQGYTREAGVRNLEREIGTICRKVARTIAEGKTDKVEITLEQVEEYLGPQRFSRDEELGGNQVGVAIGLGYTDVGGELIPVEVATMPGKGTLTITGQAGDVMQESARAALSYARSRAEALRIDQNFQDKFDLHIHLPAGATPKDGPSAGITMATALISALIRRPVRHDVAMTGEITLRGRVLPIGGVKEKVLAVHRAGIRRFVLPDRNRKDLVDVPADVQRQMEFIFVDHMDAVLPVALHAL
jgi:ATP-dependent Lon protease